MQEIRDITDMPELLSPAGGPTELKAAVQCGADAVYLGLKKNNARQGAENFTYDTLSWAVRYCHIRGVLVYLTLNTLTDEEDFEDTVEMAVKAWDMGVDAILVQDLGLAVRLHELGIVIHASTQMTVSSLEGALEARDMGFSRVVLSRELSLEDIRHITKHCGIETEVFCHGALCMCYSGQCEMSFMQGGRSGNRGSCAQPCRMPYKLDAGKQKDEYLYHLSPGDLCTLPIISKLIETGVTSLKIEGRLKNPEYVGLVTSIYRRVVDTGRYDKEDTEKLTLAFSRSTFTTGHMLGKMPSSAITLNYPGRVGLPVGRILSEPRVKSGPVPIFTVKAKLDKTLSNGDGISFGAENGGVVNGFDSTSEILTVAGKLPENVKPGDTVYQTFSKELDKEVRCMYENEDENKTEINGDFSASEGKEMTLKIYDKNIEITVTGPVPLPAVKRSTKDIEIKEALSQIGNTPFKFDRLSVFVSDGLFVPMSQVKDLRRRAVEAFSEERSKRR